MKKKKNRNRKAGLHLRGQKTILIFDSESSKIFHEFSRCNIVRFVYIGSSLRFLSRDPTSKCTSVTHGLGNSRWARHLGFALRSLSKSNSIWLQLKWTPSEPRSEQTLINLLLTGIMRWYSMSLARCLYIWQS